MTAALAVQNAIFAALLADSAVTAALGAERIVDSVPAGLQPPYVRFGPFTSQPVAPGPSLVEEHRFELLVWTKGQSRAGISAIAGMVAQAALRLTAIEAPAALANIELLTTRISRSETDIYLARLEMRAVTEIPQSD